jgi:thymidylate synthase ThyX
VPFQQFSVYKIGGQEMPQTLLLNVFKTLTDRSFKPSGPLLTEDDESIGGEDINGKTFIEQWTPAVRDQKMITKEAYAPFDHPHLSLYIRGDQLTISDLKELCRTLSFNSQSLFETADSYRIPVKDLNSSIEDFVYSRVVGFYNPDDEQAFKWTEQDRHEQLAAGYSSLLDFNAARERGIAKEVAQESLPQNLLINATVTGSLGDWLRLLDRASLMRSSYEMKSIVDSIANEISKWTPEIYRWWHSGLKKKTVKRKQKNEIAA